MGLAAQSADAGLVYDLRLAGGSHSLQAAAGGTYQLELWARVSGTNGTTSDEATQFSYITLLSTQTGGGAITAGGLSNGHTSPEFTNTEPSISRPGGGSDLNGDGIIDWGSTSTAQANTNYMLARYLDNTPGGVHGGGTTGQAVDANTWEFKLATWTLNAATVGSGTTEFKIVQPALKATVGTATYANALVDNTQFNITTANAQGTYTGSTGVTVSAAGPIPEPASIGLLGAAAVGLLGRRRKH
jgi:hypothetical protein